LETNARTWFEQGKAETNQNQAATEFRTAFSGKNTFKVMVSSDGAGCLLLLEI
jgi:hypothetical protein